MNSGASVFVGKVRMRADDDGGVFFGRMGQGKTLLADWNAQDILADALQEHREPLFLTAENLQVFV